MVFPYIYYKFKPDVGKYASPMDPMGMGWFHHQLVKESIRIIRPQGSLPSGRACGFGSSEGGETGEGWPGKCRDDN